MPRIPGIRHLFRPVVRRSVEQEIDDELAFHLQSTVDDLVAAGLARDAAEAEARRRFGDARRYRRELVRIDEGTRAYERRADRWGGVRHDLRFAWRGLRARPLFSAVAILTVALGVGANATMFGVVDRLLLKPPPHVREPERLARLYFTTVQRHDSSSWRGSTSNFTTYLAMQRAVGDAAELAVIARRELPLGSGTDAVRVEGRLVSGNYFGLLGVRPTLGRFFTTEEARPQGGLPVAVLGHGLWRSRFGADSRVIGRTIRIGTSYFTVVGVAPSQFGGTDLSRVDLWLPLTGTPETLGPRWNRPADGLSYYLDILARPTPGRDLESVASAVSVAYTRWLEHDEFRIGGPVVALPITGSWTSEGERTLEARIAIWLLGVAAVVLLVACVNVATILLARAASRQREVAVRLALGAGRGRVVRQLMVEGMLLALLGGVAALLIVRWGGDLIRTMLLHETSLEGSPVDTRVLAVAAALTLVTGFITSLAPALHASRASLSSALSEGGSGGATSRSRGQRALLVLQAALSVILLVGAGLFVRSLGNVRSLDLGFDTNVLVAEVDLANAGYDAPQTHAFFEDALRRVRALPGVERASIAWSGPLLWVKSAYVRLPGRDSLPWLPGGGPYGNEVGEDFFATLGTSVLEGRPILASDRGQPVLVVNESMAKAFWPGRSALGQCAFLSDSDSTCATVIGVVEDIRRFALSESEAPAIFTPLEAPDTSSASQWGPRRTLFIRVAGGPDAFVPVIRRTVQELRPGLPYIRIESYADRLGPQIRPWRLGASLFGAFGGLALILAAVGLFGVLAFAVVRRTREFGIRGALGADRAEIMRIVLIDGLAVVTVGVALGLAIAVVAAPRLAPLLFDTSPRDPLVIVAATLTLLTSAAVASVLPAWRAARIDPRIALQAE